MQVDGLRLTGVLGWVFWCLAHVWYLIGLRSRVVVAFDWIWSYLTFPRGARLITGREAPAVVAADPRPPRRRRWRRGAPRACGSRRSGAAG